MFQAHAPLRVQHNTNGALKILANLQEKENFIKAVYDGIEENSMIKMVAAWRQFFEVHNN